MAGKIIFGTLILSVFLLTGGISYYEWIKHCTAVDCVGGDIGN